MVSKSTSFRILITPVLVGSMFGFGTRPLGATSFPQAKCSDVVTPIKTILGFRKTKQFCFRNTYDTNIFVFVANKKIPGTQIGTDSWKIARLFQSLNQSLVKSWEWNSEGFDRDSRISPETLTVSLMNCVDTYTGCELFANRTDMRARRVSTATVKVSWIAGDCIAPPHCGGWSSSYYRLKFAITSNERFFSVD